MLSTARVPSRCQSTRPNTRCPTDRPGIRVQLRPPDPDTPTCMAAISSITQGVTFRAKLDRKGQYPGKLFREAFCAHLERSLSIRSSRPNATRPPGWKRSPQRRMAKVARRRSGARPAAALSIRVTTSPSIGLRHMTPFTKREAGTKIPPSDHRRGSRNPLPLSPACRFVERLRLIEEPLGIERTLRFWVAPSCLTTRMLWVQSGEPTAYRRPRWASLRTPQVAGVKRDPRPCLPVRVCS
jgi:hypothetical protein